MGIVYLYLYLKVIHGTNFTRMKGVFILKSYIKTHFLAFMLSLAILLTACGGAKAEASDATSETSATSSGAGMEIAEKPSPDELSASGTYGRVTAIDGYSLTLATGSYNGGRHDDKGEPPEAPSGSMPDGATPPDGEAPPEAPSGSMPEGGDAPSGVDIGGAYGEKGGSFTEDGSALTLVLTDSTAVTLQTGTHSSAASLSDIEIGDIVVIDEETATSSVSPAAVTIIRAPEGKQQ